MQRKVDRKQDHGVPNDQEPDGVQHLDPAQTTFTIMGRLRSSVTRQRRNCTAGLRLAQHASPDGCYMLFVEMSLQVACSR